MNVIAFAGFSGSGKTTLIEKLIVALKARGQRVSVVKHAHKRFDIDQPGKDTWRHREAGAFEVVIASNKRLALMREFEQDADLNVHHMIAELYDGVDWVLVEGFKHADLLKIEVWRPSLEKPARFEDDDFIVAIASDEPTQLEGKTLRPVFNLGEPEPIADWLMQHADRFRYDHDKYQPR
jgi:molybdopterin-guanine dinucleotide biosynthesis adapter protein